MFTNTLIISVPRSSETTTKTNIHNNKRSILFTSADLLFVQDKNIATWKYLRPNVCQTRWFWWNLRCTAAWEPAAVQSESTDRSVAAPVSWPSSTGDARDVAAAESNYQIATCRPSVAARSRRRHTSKQPTPAYRVSVIVIRKQPIWLKPRCLLHVSCLVSKPTESLPLPKNSWKRNYSFL